MNRQSGFTIAELLVAIAVISILATVVLFNTSGASMESRNADRQANLQLVKSGLELYKLKYDRYPEGCNGPGVWSGQVGTDHDCPTGSGQYEYIVGLAPEFIPTLPQDPKLNGTDSGYVYVTNTEGSVFKFMAKNTVEYTDSADSVQRGHPFQSCDVNTMGGAFAGLCNASYGGNANSLNSWCNPNDGSDDQFDMSYAVWGGVANGANATWIERNTEAIVCDIR